MPTPLHLFHADRLREDARLFRDALRAELPQAGICYSVKTNPLLAVLQILQEEGYGFEATTPLDLRAMKRLGVRPTVVNGSAKTKADFQYAVYEAGAEILHVDSLAQVEILEQLLRESPFPAHTRFGIRLNNFQGPFGAFKGTHDLIQYTERLVKSGLKPTSLHMHVNAGGGLQSLERTKNLFLETFRHLVEQKRALEEKIPYLNFDTLDLGGGFHSPHIYRMDGEEHGAYARTGAVPEAAREARPDLAATLTSTFRALKQRLQEEDLEYVKLLFEPGRCIATRALSSLLRIVVKKPGFYDGMPVYFTDGNTQLFNGIKLAIHPVDFFRATGEAFTGGEKEAAFFYGNLPYEADILYQRESAPKAMEAGDFLRIEYTGAYFTPFETNFGHPRPGIVCAATGKILRERETVDALLERDRL